MASTRTTTFMTKILPSFLTLSILTLTLTSSATFTPTDHYLVNCGSRAAQTLDPHHRTFTPDNSPILLTSTHTTTLQNTHTPSSIYHTARAFTRPAHYAFPINSHHHHHHVVRLHFYPLQTPHFDLLQSQFHVIANGFLLLRDFRVSTSSDFPVIKEFLVPVEREVLEITFLPSKLGFVSAIEVISMPGDLIADVAQLVGVGESERVDGVMRSGFETVHRVNVGGFKVTPFNDSLWRTWVTDEGYLRGVSGVETVHFGGRIHYWMGGASREVGPDNIYNTARVVRGSDGSVANANLTMEFGVEKGYRYLIRLHFCDLASLALNMVYFNVYVNGNLAFENLDLSDKSSGVLASPYYADVLVDVRDSEALIVSVGPSNRSLPRAVDGILNGVEVWKVNNSMSSFDGEVCAGFVRRVWRQGHGGGSTVLVPLVAAVLLLLSAGVFVQWRRRAGSVGWSRLPVDVSEGNLKSSYQFSSVKA